MTNRIPDYNFTEDQVIEAIKGTCGIISNISEKMGCCWTTAKKYTEMSDRVRLAYSNECERVIDKAENKLQAAIDSGDMQMVKWYLATKGKRRGYVEKQEIDHSGNINIAVIDTDDSKL
jgi:hypothetical protein